MGRRVFPRGTLVSSSLALLFAASVVNSADFKWFGGAGTWSAANWSMPTFPNSFAGSAAIDGGNALASSVTLDIAASIGGLTIDAGDALAIPGSTLTVQGAIINNGSLLVSGAGQLIVQGTATLAGVGSTTLNGGTVRAAGFSGLEELTIASGHTLRGTGAIAPLLKVTNHGNIAVETPAGLEVWSLSNHGTVDIAAGSALTTSNIISGGRITGSGNARLHGFGAIRDTTFSGNLNVFDTTGVQLGGTIVNAGILNVGNGTTGGIFINGTLKLAGEGTTVLNKGFLGNLRNGELTIDSNHTVRGSGGIFPSKITNRGHVLAEGPAGLELSHISNEGLFEVADGSFLRIAESLQGGEIRGNGVARLLGGIIRDTTLTGTLSVHSTPLLSG